MKLSVSQIRNGSFKGPVEFEGTVDVSELSKMNNEVRNTHPAEVKAVFTVDRDEIFANLEIKGELILPCARTLVDVPYQYDISVDEVFSTSSYLTEEELENEIHPIEGEVLDLKPYILENILLDIPYRVFTTDPDPVGAAPTEGDGWSFVQDEPKEQTIDPRLEKLAAFFEKQKKENK